jgi:hypothetical protein
LNKKPKLGSLVMTPMGIGSLIKMQNNLSTVKFIEEDKVESFDENLVVTEFPVYIKILMDQGRMNCYRMNMPVKADICQFKQMINNLQILNSEECDFNLIYNAEELPDNLAFSKIIGLRSEAKFLIGGMRETEYKLLRYTSTEEYWYCNPDAIVFSVNKKIKLSGVGLYISMDGVIQTGSITIHEVEDLARNSGHSRGRGRRSNIDNEDNYRESLLFSDSVSVPDVSSDPNNKVHKISFRKPVKIKPFSNYKLELSCNSSTETWYGLGAKSSQLGDRNVKFTFNSAGYETSSIQGNFAEFYYYL